MKKEHKEILDKIGKECFNGFDGDNIQKFLNKHKNYWKDIEYSNGDTIFLLPYKTKREQCILLGHALSADEISFETRNGKEVLRLWWD